MNQEKIKLAREHVFQTHGEFSQPANSYIILFNPRSGSNLITTHLQSIGFGNPFEAFHYNHKRLRNEQGWDFDFSDSPIYLRNVIETLTVDNVFGMKINWRQFPIFISVLKDIVGEMGDGLTKPELIEVFFPGVRYLFLKRRNKIRQAISFSKGMQTGMWKVAPSRYELLKEYTIPAVYDHEHIECCLDELLAYDESWENYLEESRLDYYRIWYEDIAKNFQENMLDLYKYLGVDNNIPTPQPFTKRLANKQSEKWLDDFIRETNWLEDKALHQALVDGNTRFAFSSRAGQVFFSKGQERWYKMPRNRFKKIKYLIFRLQVKLRKKLNR